MDVGRIRDVLVSDAGLSVLQARAYLSVTCGGAAGAGELAERLKVGADEAGRAARDLVALGALIELDGGFEATHPRFAAVRMYRRACERRGEAPGRNRDIDSVGGLLEGPYEDARAK